MYCKFTNSEIADFVQLQVKVAKRGREVMIGLIRVENHIMTCLSGQNEPVFEKNQINLATEELIATK
jgi:hypothetical protein